jgi:subtilisin family serine protease
MKKILSYLFLVILFLYPAIASASEYRYVTQDYAEGDVIVTINAPLSSDYFIMNILNKNLYSQALSSQADVFARKYGFSASNATLSEIARISGKNIIHIRSENKSTEQMIRELSSAHEVENISPNYITRVETTPNDWNYLSSSQYWGMQNINMPQVWDYVKGSNYVCVAVFDSGIDYYHQDLNVNMAIDSYGYYGRRFYNGNGTESTNSMALNEHGTHVAGIIGAKGNNSIGVAGVNWNVKMLNVNVTTWIIPTPPALPHYGTYDYDLYKGVNYVLSEKANGLNIRVANISLGGWLTPPGSYYLEESVRLLSDAGIIVTMSAGNEGQNINSPTASYVGKRHYPSSYRFENTISVGSIKVNNDKSSFSNYGSQWVDIAAPGGEVFSDGIYSTLPNNTYGYNYGTSMAAPHVAGAAAILCEAYPFEAPSQIKWRILTGAKNIGVSSGFWASGTLDVWAAYTLSTPPLITTTSLPASNVGALYSQMLSASGTFPIIWSLDSGSLPPGLNLYYSSIYGYPTTPGTYTFTLKATNTAGYDTKTFIIYIDPNPGILTDGCIQILDEYGVVVSDFDRTFGDRIDIRYILLGDTIRFAPEPYNATISSIEWESNVFDFIYPDQLESPFDLIDYGEGYLSVTVNGVFNMEFSLVTGPRK